MRLFMVSFLCLTLLSALCLAMNSVVSSRLAAPKFDEVQTSVAAAFASEASRTVLQRALCGIAAMLAQPENYFLENKEQLHNWLSGFTNYHEAFAAGDVCARLRLLDAVLQGRLLDADTFVVPGRIDPVVLISKPHVGWLHWIANSLWNSRITFLITGLLIGNYKDQITTGFKDFWVEVKSTGESQR